MLLAAGLLVFLPQAQARADVGVEKVSRSGGVPGDEVTLTIGCGFCYPPYDEALGRQGPCMPGPEAPPASFPVSLVPIEKAPKPHRCGPNLICAPRALAPPRRLPFTFLGPALPSPAAAGPRHSDDRHQVPRYLLNFEIPDLRPGVYTFVIYCDACLPGKAGSLIAYPRARPWRLRVRPSSPEATIGAWGRVLGVT